MDEKCYTTHPEVLHTPPIHPEVLQDSGGISRANHRILHFGVMTHSLILNSSFVPNIMYTCIFCNYSLKSTEEACGSCGFCDPLLICEDDTVTAKAVTDTLSKQLQSSTFLDIARNTTTGDIFDIFAEFHKERKILEAQMDETKATLMEKEQTIEFYRTLVEAYKNNNYTINLRDHHEETNMRVQAGAWGVIKCPVDKCNGRVFKQTGVCSLCNVTVCFDCMSPKEDAHTCAVDKKKSVERLIQSCFPCPMCLTAIQKQSGCDQIFCTVCHHSFDYQTGASISRRNLHNPHFDEFQQQQEQGNHSENEHVQWIKDNIIPSAMPDGVQRALNTQETVFRNSKWHFLFNQHAMLLLHKSDTRHEEYASVTFSNGWVDSIKIPGSHIHRTIIDMMTISILDYEEIAKDAPDHNFTIAEDAFMTEKLRWLTENTEEDEQAFMNKMVKAKEDKAKAYVDWICIQRVLKIFINMDQYVKKNVQNFYNTVVQTKERGGDMDECLMSVKNTLYNMHNTVIKVIGPYLVVKHPKAYPLTYTVPTRLMAKLRDVGKTKSLNECIICSDDNNKPLRCPYCLMDVCFSCMEHWWKEDACKLQMTMPCCKRSAWGCLGLFRSKSNRYNIVKKLLSKAVLEEEKAKKYKYVTFVENKQHASFLEQEIVDIRSKINNVYRSTLRDLAEKKIHIREVTMEKMSNIKYPGCLAACFDLCPIELPQISTVVLRRATMVPEIPLQLFERECINALDILHTYTKGHLKERIIEYSMRLRLRSLVMHPPQFVCVSVLFDKLSNDIFGQPRASYSDMYRRRRAIQVYRSIGGILSSITAAGYCRSECLKIMNDSKRQRTT